MSIAPFQLSQSDARAMYVQIMDHIQHSIISGVWPAGHPLPSIRELAVALRVSVITVKRAYQELERDGVIVTRHGRGSFVAEQIGLVSQQKERELEQHLLNAVAVAHLLKMDCDTLQQKLKSIFVGDLNS